MYTVSSFSRPKSSPGSKRSQLTPISTTTANEAWLQEDPRTPEARDGRQASGSGAWTDSGGSRVPLVPKTRPGLGLQDVAEASDGSVPDRASRSPVNVNRPSPLGRANTSRDIVPGTGAGLKLPESVHDDYVSAMLSPEPTHLASPTIIHRSTSAPDNQQAGGVGRELFASSDNEVPGKIIPVHKAKLLEGGLEMERNLRGHLDEVLKVQMEIGRMHHDLEAVGGTLGDEAESMNVDKARRNALSRREDGLDAIMDQLANLSNILRSYHAQGTPQLSFPQPSTKTAASSPIDLDVTAPAEQDEGLQPPAVPIASPNPPTTSAPLPPATEISPTRSRPLVTRSSTTAETSSSSSRTTPKKTVNKSTWASVFGGGGGTGNREGTTVQSPMELDKVDRKRPW